MDTDRTLQPMAGGRLGRVALSCVRLASLAVLALPAAAPAKRGSHDGLRGCRQYQSSEPAERPSGWTGRWTPEPGIVRLAITWAERRSAQRPPDPTNPGSAFYDFSSIDGAGARCRGAWPQSAADRQRRPGLGGGTGAAGLGSCGHLEAESLRPRRLRPGGCRSLLGQLRPGRPRPGAAATPRRRRFRSGTSPTRTPGSRPQFQGKTAVGPDFTGTCSTPPTEP